MTSCKLDHSIEDVKNKLDAQKPYLPINLYLSSLHFITTSPTQLQLNELFHLLKKYDLSSDEEKLLRNQKLEELL